MLVFAYQRQWELPFFFAIACSCRESIQYSAAFRVNIEEDAIADF